MHLTTRWYMVAAALWLPLYAITTTDKNPFSSVQITSAKATCCKQAHRTVMLTYQGNVLTTLADGTTIQSDTLCITLCTDQAPTSTIAPGTSMRHIKDLQAHGNICIKNKQHTVCASHAQLEPGLQQLRLWQEVRIKQKALNAKDAQLDLTGYEAVYDIKSQKACLVGTTHTPVHTTIVLPPAPKTTKKKRP